MDRHAKLVMPDTMFAELHKLRRDLEVERGKPGVRMNDLLMEAVSLLLLRYGRDVNHVGDTAQVEGA